MAKGKKLLGYINLDELMSQKDNKEVVFTNKKGQTCINVVQWVNEEPDNYGNLTSLQIQKTKEEQKIYIGNFREFKEKNN